LGGLANVRIDRRQLEALRLELQLDAARPLARDDRDAAQRREQTGGIDRRDAIGLGRDHLVVVGKVALPHSHPPLHPPPPPARTPPSTPSSAGSSPLSSPLRSSMTALRGMVTARARSARSTGRVIIASRCPSVATMRRRSLPSRSM